MAKHNPEDTILMNMCVLRDENNNVLALDKVTGRYRGTTFPGGHVEKGEVFRDAIIREFQEETGLIIDNPVLCGLYHWYREDIHNILIVYSANSYKGEINSSREGEVYWIPLEELKKKDLATGTEHVIKLTESNEIFETVMRPDGDTYSGTLY